MGHISFNPSQRLIRLPIKVDSINSGNYRDLIVALDTGSSNTSIPTKIASDLGYDLSNPKQEVDILASNGIFTAKIITVRKLTAIGETVENIDVLCHDLPVRSTIDGVLGLNFLSHFDIKFRSQQESLNSIQRSKQQKQICMPKINRRSDFNENFSNNSNSLYPTQCRMYQ